MPRLSKESFSNSDTIKERAQIRRKEIEAQMPPGVRISLSYVYRELMGKSLGLTKEEIHPYEGA